MHELDITENLIEQIKNLAKENNIKDKATIYVELGKLSTFSKKPIEFYYEQLTKKDKFFKDKDFRLEIVDKSGMIECMDCKEKSKINELFDMICPKCYSTNTKIIAGKDVMIKKIEF